MANEIEYMQIQWNDIHHTRNQDWKIIALILADFYALFNSSSDNAALQVALAILGLVLSLIGISITMTHWKNFYFKIKVIEDCEAELGLGGEFYRARYPVQAHILVVYILIFSALLGWLSWVVTQDLVISFSVATLLQFGGIWFSFYWAKHLQKSILSLGS